MQRKFKVAVNRHIVNKIDKKNGAQLRILTAAFENVELTPQELASFINVGNPFCAQHEGDRKNANFLCSDVVAVDIDAGMKIGDALQIPYVQQHASILYTTPSHTEESHRFRIVFHLERTITDPLEMRAAYLGVIRLFAGDESCNDPCRLFFGSKGSNPIVLGNTLPNDELNKLMTLGRELHVCDSDGDPDGRTKRTPVTNRSMISLERNLQVQLKGGSMAPLQDLNVRAPIHCPVHFDNNPSAIVVVNKKGKRGVYCSTCALTFWPESPTRSQKPHYDFNRVTNAVRQLAHEEFPYHHDDLYNADDDGNLIEPTSQDIAEWKSVIDARTHIVLYEKFLPEIRLQSGLTLINSPKGSGKTKRLEQISRECQMQGLSVLLVGHRQPLIQNLAHRLNLTCYLRPDAGKLKNNRPDERYAICVDSMGKLLNPQFHHYDVIILDEAEQILNHVATASTLKEKRRHCYQLLCHYISQAQSVILCDADLGAVSIEAMCQIIDSSVPFRFYLNDYRPPLKHYDLYADEKHLLAGMLEAIGNGGRHYVSTNSKRKAKEIYVAVTTSYPDKKVRLVTAENSAEVDTQHFIANIKSEILNLDVVIASPTLGTGIDITFDNEAQEIDTVFGFFVSRVNTHFDIDQQLARVRHPKAVKVWVTPERFNFETDPSAIEAELIMCRNLNDVIIGYTRGAPLLDESFLKVFSQVTAIQRASKNALRHHFVKLREKNGWEVKMIERAADSAKKGAAHMKDAKALIESDRINAVCNAVPISEEEYRKLVDMQKTKLITPANENSMRHYELSSFYRTDVDEKLIELDDNGKFRGCVRLAEAYFATRSSIKDRNRHINDSISLAPDAAQVPLKCKLLRELLTSAGLADDSTPIKCDVSFKQENLTQFVATYKKNTRRIEELFGLKVRGDLDGKAVQSLAPILNLLGLTRKESANYKVGKKKRIREYQVDSDSVKLVNEIIYRRASFS